MLDKGYARYMIDISRTEAGYRIAVINNSPRSEKDMNKQEQTIYNKGDLRATVKKHNRYTGYLVSIYGYNEHFKKWKIIQLRNIKGLERAHRLALRWTIEHKYLDQK